MIDGAQAEPTEGGTVLAACDGQTWGVAHVRPRCEKKLAETCRREAMTCYLPLRAREHRYGRRKRVFFTPLFPGYLFARVDPDQRTFLRQNHWVARWLDVPDEATLLNQLIQVDRALRIGQVKETLPYLCEGHAVRVRSGPMKGMDGIVQGFRGKTRVVLNVDMIGHAVVVDVPYDVLEAL